MTIQSASDNVTNLIGSLEALADAFPPTNADGTSNEGARSDAVGNTVVSLVTSGLFQLPSNSSVAQVRTFALGLLNVLDAYKKATGKTVLT